MKGNRFGLGLAAGTVVLFVAHACLVGSGVMPVSKTESNFFSSRARLQRAASVEEPKIALLGSSITGRLPDAASGELDVMNLGADGGSTWNALKGFLDGPFKTPPVVIVEANTLFAGLHGGGEKGGVAAQLGPWFEVGCELPVLRADSRPSSMVYQTALERSRGDSQVPAELQTPPALEAEKPRGIALEGRGEMERARFDEAAKLLAELGGRTRVVVVFYPNGEKTEGPRPGGTAADGRALASAAGVEFLDLATELSGYPLGFTDAVHMNRASARFALQTLLKSFPAGSAAK